MRRLLWAFLAVAVIAGAFAYVDETNPPWYERIRYPLRTLSTCASTRVSTTSIRRSSLR